MQPGDIHLRPIAPTVPNRIFGEFVELNGGFMFWDHDGSHGEWKAPADMPTAVPWQAKDGEWYWRMESR